MLCLRCNKKLSGKQEKYCSPKCSKLHLKSLYRKRNADKIRDYNREYKKLGIRGSPSTNGIIKIQLILYPQCAKCGTKENVQVAHIKPRWAGGRNKNNLISLCVTHHSLFDRLLKDFWKL